VEFWTPWSLICPVLDPILSQVAAAWAGKAKVVKVDADQSLDLSLLYKIHSIPTLIYFNEGKPHFRMVGTASKETILAKLKPLGAPQ
jgi:thioredoxin-like negative regulator of GroEL